jgi:DDE superfamily endonuclease
VTQALAPHGRRVRVMFMDEARFGQQGTLTRVWAPKGSRPTAIKQTRYEWVYLYAAVEPETGFSSALVAPSVNTDTFNAFLRILAGEVDRDDHIILILDQAGWHRTKAVRVRGGR